jgi:hypothetical protein
MRFGWISIILMFMFLVFSLFSPISVFEVFIIESEECSHYYTIDGENKDVDVYKCDTKSKFGLEDNYAYSEIGGSVVLVDSEDIGKYGGELILHELGHSLGYRHSYNASIMDSTPEEPMRNNLTPIERELAVEFESLRIINWNSSEDIKYLESEDVDGFEHLVGSNCTSIYYEDSLYRDKWTGDRFYNKCDMISIVDVGG